MHRAPCLLVALALLLGPACNDLDTGEEPLSLGSQDDFATQVQPYVGLACGSLDCHGERGRALRLYAEHGLRLTDELRDEPVAADEIAANVRSFSGVSPDLGGDFTEHLALLKGLDPEAGGYDHVGETIWASTAAPGYQCILAWLEGRSGEDDAITACAAAYDDVRIDDE